MTPNSNRNPGGLERLLKPNRPKFVDVVAALVDLPSAQIAELCQPPRRVRMGYFSVDWIGPTSGVSPATLASVFRTSEQVVTANLCTTDPNEAYEILASRDIVPFSWIESSTRKYHQDAPCVFCHGACASDASLKCDACASLGLTAQVLHQPPSIEMVVTLASDAEGVAAAEQMAVECVLDELGSDVELVWRILAEPDIPAALVHAKASWQAVVSRAITRSLEAEKSILSLGYVLGPINIPNRSVQIWAPALGADQLAAI